MQLQLNRSVKLLEIVTPWKLTFWCTARVGKLLLEPEDQGFFWLDGWTGQVTSHDQVDHSWETRSHGMQWEWSVTISQSGL